MREGEKKREEDGREIEREEDGKEKERKRQTERERVG